MAWTSPRTWTACEVVTATLLNTHVRDNLLMTGPAVVTTKGDIVAATAANTLARVGISGSNGAFLVENSGCNAGVCWDGTLQISGSTEARLSAASNPFYTFYVSGSRRGYLQYLGGSGLMQVVNESTASPGIRFVLNSATEVMRLSGCGGAGQVLIGATASNSNMATGLTIVSASSGQGMALKGPSFAHGMTSLVETDTYGALGVTSGRGVFLRGYGDSFGNPGRALELSGYWQNSDTTKGTSGTAHIYIQAGTRSGTSASNVAANGNLVAIANFDIVQFIFDADGDLHANAAVTASSYDAFDDAHLIRALEIERNPAGVIRTEFDNWLRYNRGHLEAAKVATFNDRPGGDGSIFVNYTALARLQSGAIWQLYTANQALTRQVRLLESQLSARTGSLFGGLATSASMERLC